MSTMTWALHDNMQYDTMVLSPVCTYNKSIILMDKEQAGEPSKGQSYLGPTVINNVQAEGGR